MSMQSFIALRTLYVRVCVWVLSIHVELCCPFSSALNAPISFSRFVEIVALFWCKLCNLFIALCVVLKSISPGFNAHWERKNTDEKSEVQMKKKIGTRFHDMAFEANKLEKRIKMNF